MFNLIILTPAKVSMILLAQEDYEMVTLAMGVTIQDI